MHLAARIRPSSRNHNQCLNCTPPPHVSHLGVAWCGSIRMSSETTVHGVFKAIVELGVTTPTNQFRVPDTERVSQVAPEATPHTTTLPIGS